MSTNNAPYYERRRIFVALYFEMRQLPWLKRKWKKTEEDFSQPGTFTHAYVETDLMSRQSQR